MSKPVYVVLGVHRGGTSAIARALVTLGISLGNNLMPGVPENNERGFWEDLDLVSLNEEVLLCLNETWHSIRFFDEELIRDPRIEALVSKGASLLGSKVDADAAFGFKDPRSSRLLFFWKRVFEAAELAPRYVVAVRNPLSVADSLAKRDQFSPEKAYLIWLLHMLSAVHETHGSPRVAVDYDLLLKSPTDQLARIQRAFQLPDSSSDAVERYVGDFLSDGLRHSTYDERDLQNDPRVPALVRRLYAILHRLAYDEASPKGNKVLREAKKLLSEANELAPMLSLAERAIREVDAFARVVDNRDRELREYQKVVDNREAHIQELSAQLAARDQRLSQSKHVLAARDTEVAEYKKVVANREDHIRDLGVRLTEQEQRLAQQDRTVAARDTEIAEYQKIVANREEHIQHLGVRLAEQEQRLAQQDRTVAARDTEIAEYQKIVANREEHIQHLGVRLAEQEQRLSERTAETELLGEEVATITAALNSERDAVTRLQARLDALGKQKHAVALRLAHIENSSFWRYSAHVRAAWRVLETRILGRDFAFHLVPNDHLRFIGEDHDWRATGQDPHFLMIPADGRFPSGWVLITSSLRRHSESGTLKLYYDAGSGMSEETAIALSVDASGVVEELVQLPRTIKHLRWDPMEWTGELSQDAISISRVGPVSRWVHHVSRVWQLFREHDVNKRRELGISWKSLLFQPQRTYEATSALRTGYETWCKTTGLTDSDRDAIRCQIQTLERRPLISILMPVYNTPAHLLRMAIESVLSQLYDTWELCIADDASSEMHVRQILEEYQQRDTRIKVHFRASNGHISAASNSALDLASGDFLALLDHDDTLAEEALYLVVVDLATNPDTDVLYSDEDKIDESDRRHLPVFKCDWNPDLLLSQNYVSHLGVYRTSLVKQIGGFREGYEGSQDYDLLLRCLAERRDLRVRHIPAVLYHWRATSGSTAQSGDHKDYATESGIRALEDHLHTVGIKGASVEAGRFPTTYRIRYPIPSPSPTVSLIIPTRNKHDILRACIDSILQKTTYSNYEIVVVDNGTDEPESLQYLNELRDQSVRVLSFDAPFNYPAINNYAVEQVSGEIVGLINNDIEVITPGWLEEMVSHAVRPEIGAVGAKLYYSNDTLQHGGVIVGLGGVAGHSHKHFPREAPGYGRRLFLTQNVSAVTAACLLVRRQAYIDVGGMDADNLAVAFNDVDFCLKLVERGLRNVWTPYAELYHHESVSRGLEDSPEKMARFQAEMAYMMRRWGDRLRHDPFYSPMLSLDHEDFRPNFNAMPPRPWLSIHPMRPSVV
jgi:O-antigen biosynthesis protein